MKTHLPEKTRTLCNTFLHFLKQPILSILLLILISLQSINSQITVSKWRMNRGKAAIMVPKIDSHGDPSAYSKCEIPDTNNGNWEAAPVDHLGRVHFTEESKLAPVGTCLRRLDFTYFETFINIPKNTKLNELKVKFTKADDGARAYIFNSAHPNGAYIGEIKLYDNPATKDYSSLAVVGERNRLVVVQFDDCPFNNQLTGAEVIANGTAIISCNLSTKVKIENASCHNTDDGSAEITVSGGTKPYSFIWHSINSRRLNNPTSSTTIKVTGLLPNKYDVEIKDAKGCSKTIRVKIGSKDAETPIVKTKNITVELDNTGKVSINENQINNGSTDNCKIASLHLDKKNFNCSNIGKNTVKLTVTDKNGNKATKTAIVTVKDNLAPVFSNVPADITLKGASSCTCKSLPTSWTPPTATDNCSGVTITSNYKPGDIFPAGNNKVTYTATDKVGNKSTVSFNVFVPIIPMDIKIREVKNISCKNSKGSVTIKAIGGCKPYRFIWDNGNDTNNGLADKTIKDLKEGEHIITVKDRNGNKTTKKIVIKTIKDTEAPVFSNIPADITLKGASSCTCKSLPTSWTPPTATDNCSDVTITSNYKPGDTFPAGTTKVTYTATDKAGNKSTVSFNVFVPIIPMNIKIISTKNAVCMEGKGSVTIKAIGGCKPYRFIWENGNDTNNGLADKTIEDLKVGEHKITVKDRNGNKYTTKVTITSEDKEAPVITNIPSTINVKGGCTGSVATWTEPIAKDNCSVVKFTSDYKSGDTFPVGTTKVTYTATDSSGNSTSASFDVTVKESIPSLVIDNSNIVNVTCNGNSDGAINISVQGGCKPYTFDWSNGATTKDINNLKAGSYTVTIKDNSGKTVTKTFEVTEPNLLVSHIEKIKSYNLPIASINNPNIILGLPGYPEYVDLKSNATGGNGNYTYSWSGTGAKYLNDTSIANPRFTPKLKENSCCIYNLKLTITDDKGCSTTCEVPVKVINVGITCSVRVYDHKAACYKYVNVKKVVICYQGKTCMIDSKDVNYYLKCGALLGSCNCQCSTATSLLASNTATINNVINEPSLSAYPNPSNGVFNIKLDSNKEKSTVVLLDFNGNVVNQIDVNENNSDNLSVGNNNLPSGRYFLKYISNGKVITKQLMVK